MILIAGVGYSHLSDLSFGPLLVEELQRHEWPDHVQIEDLSYGPIAVVQWFQDEPGRFDQAIFIGAVQRDGGIPRELRVYRWQHGNHTIEDVQRRVAEGVTGIVSLENLLMITDYFKVLPHDTSVIEVEPVEVEFGLEVSPLGQQRLVEVREVIERVIMGTTEGAAPSTSLGTGSSGRPPSANIGRPRRASPTGDSGSSSDR
jgi:hydrogenase maturation protease